jgi:hypothetical protein
MKNNIKSPELIADYFISYLYQNYRGSRHVRRVASWVGFVILALTRIGDVKNIKPRRTRQLEFDYKQRKFKVKFNHKIGGRGGIEIVEFFAGRGEPEGNTVIEIKTLLEAENAYHSLEDHLNNFVATKTEISN